MKKNKNSTALIKTIATELGYTTKYLSKTGSPRRLLISNGKKMCVVNSSIFGFYPTTLRWQQHLFDSKIHTQEVLNLLGYTTIPSTVVIHKQYTSFAELEKKIIPRIKKYPSIIKREKGFYGKDITIVRNKTQLRDGLRSEYSAKVNVQIQPILPYDEYRILIINGIVELVHIKQLHCVEGDGTQTLAQLLAAKPAREKDELFISEQLVLRGWSVQHVPEKDEKFPYHITRFSDPGSFYEADNIPARVRSWAKKLTKDISVETIGIDVFAPNGLNDPASYIIIELNANPAFDYIWKRYGDPDTMRTVVTNALTSYFS